MNSLKYIISLFLCAFLLGSCTITGQSQTKSTETTGDLQPASGPQERDLKILASTRQLAQMIQDLTDGQHTVDYMAGSEAELKTMVPDPAMMDTEGYQAFFYVGAGLEPFIRELSEGLDKNRVNLVNVSRGIDIRRYKVNKLDMENPYYLTNSTNYKIALNSIKNALQEMDPARRTLYDESFVKISRQIDTLQSEIHRFMTEHRELVFLAESDSVYYVFQEYGMDFQTITEYSERMGLMENTQAKTQPSTAAKETRTLPDTDGNSLKSEKRIFLYTEDLAIRKYSEDIIKYNLLPVKINLYNPETTLMDSFGTSFREIRKAVETS